MGTYLRRFAYGMCRKDLEFEALRRTWAHGPLHSTTLHCSVSVTLALYLFLSLFRLHRIFAKTRDVRRRGMAGCHLRVVLYLGQ